MDGTAAGVLIIAKIEESRGNALDVTAAFGAETVNQFVQDQLRFVCERASCEEAEDSPAGACCRRISANRARIVSGR